MGLAMGYGAHTAHLQRCKVGPFDLTQAYSLAYLQQQAERGTFAETLMPLARALKFLPVLSLSAQQYQALRMEQGRTLSSLLEDIPQLSQQESRCYRLRTQPKGTFAVMYRHASVPEKWKVAYLEIPSSPARPVCT
jgi:tRNA U55 pseudouridine synthase TruB